MPTIDDFIPYLVSIRLDKQDGLADRIKDSVPRIISSLKELGEVEPAMLSYDGSCFSFLLEAEAHYQPWQIVKQLESPRSRKPSGFVADDRVLVVSIDAGCAKGLERPMDWLRDHELLVSDSP